MLTLAQLKQQPQSVRETTGWFLPGDEVPDWLETCARCPFPTEELRFYVVNDPLHQTVAGALVLLPKSFAVPVGARAQAYGELKTGFFLPIDAILWPPMTQAEVGAAMHYPVMLFHPGLGLSGFEVGAERRAWDLLQPLPPAGERWNRARGGVRSPPRLRSVRPEALISLEEIFGDESQDIGSAPPEDLSPSPDEPTSNLPARAAQAAASMGAAALSKLLSLVPRTAGAAPNWARQLEKWASGKLASIAKNLEEQRHKELHRLLDLLAKNPEEGLRHAISLADLQSRGRAPPSARLGERSLDFNLRRIGGGGPADAWSVPADVQAQLAKSYREMAYRESKLGRYRRAACIYAELLGDFSSAANALKQGRHFQEAALLYQERLNNPLAAAECFAEGGMPHEAIAILEKHGRWMEVSELYLRLGQQEESNRALRRLVEVHLAAGDVIKAAELFETKLEAPDEALGLLTSTWPDGRQALQALEARFALLQRLNRSDQILALVTTLAAERLSVSRVSPIINTLTRLAESSTVPTIRKTAAEAVRAKVSFALTERTLESADEISVLRALTRLAPEDRLLTRDARRFREERKVTAAPRVIPLPNAAARTYRAEKGDTLKLPSGGTWIRVLADGDGFFAMARLPKPRIFVTRGTWDGALQSLDWDDPAPQLGATLALAAHHNAVVMARPFAEPFPIKNVAGTDAFSWRSCAVGTPDWWPSDTVQVASSRFTLWIVRIISSRVVLASYQNGSLIYTRDVTDELVAAGATGAGTTLSLDAQGGMGRVALGYSQHLLILENQRELSVRDLGSRVLGLLPAPATTPGWIALLDRGAVFAPGQSNTVVELDDSMEAPRGAFLKNGSLVLASGNEARILKLGTPKPTPLGRFALPGGPGIALAATNKPEEFATFQANGVVQKWTLV